MDKAHSIILAALVGLAGCSGSSQQLQPGEWEITYVIGKATSPTVPADVLASMKGATETARRCITPEQAAKPDGEMLLVASTPWCKFTHFTAAAGKIAGTMACPATQAFGPTHMTMQGRYEAQSYELTSQLNVDNPGQPMRYETRTTGRRIGECAAKK